MWTYPAGETALLARYTEKLASEPQEGRSDSPTSKGHGSGWTTTWNSRTIALVIHLEESKLRHQNHRRELNALLIFNPLAHNDDVDVPIVATLIMTYVPIADSLRINL